MTDNDDQVELSVSLIEAIKGLKLARHLIMTIKLKKYKAKNEFTKKRISEIEYLIENISNNINELKE